MVLFLANWPMGKQ